MAHPPACPCGSLRLLCARANQPQSECFCACPPLHQSCHAARSLQSECGRAVAQDASRLTLAGCQLPSHNPDSEAAAASTGSPAALHLCLTAAPAARCPPFTQPRASITGPTSTTISMATSATVRVGEEVDHPLRPALHASRAWLRPPTSAVPPPIPPQPTHLTTPHTILQSRQTASTAGTPSAAPFPWTGSWCWS